MAQCKDICLLPLYCPRPCKVPIIGFLESILHFSREKSFVVWRQRIWLPLLFNSNKIFWNIWKYFSSDMCGPIEKCCCCFPANVGVKFIGMFLLMCDISGMIYSSVILHINNQVSQSVSLRQICEDDLPPPLRRITRRWATGCRTTPGTWWGRSSATPPSSSPTLFSS